MREPPLSLKARALQCLAQREHSRTELRRKLLRLARQRALDQATSGSVEVATGAADPAAEVDALLDWLVAESYLSDTRFIESRVNARAARYGNLRIHHELERHGAALDAATAERLKASELARARAVWMRKYGNAPATQAAERARQMRFLAGRGFSADVIRQVVRDGPSQFDDGP